MGTSMGGMHTWMWGTKHAGFVDYLMPLASLPGPMSGRNRMWRKMLSEAIRTDPEWQGGDYQKQPRSLRLGAEMLYFMSSNPVIRQKEAPPPKKPTATSWKPPTPGWPAWTPTTCSTPPSRRKTTIPAPASKRSSPRSTR